MDVCCYNRPMDDQTQERVHVETEAIFYILKNLDKRGWDLIGSSVVEYEFKKNSDVIKQQSAYKFFDYTKTTYNILDYPDTQARANIFQSHGIGSIDSLHLAISECAGVEVLLTTDDRFIKAAKRTDTKVKVINPLIWLMEVSYNE